MTGRAAKTGAHRPSILFVHQNYPAQFGKFALYLKAQGWDVLFATSHKAASRKQVTVVDGGLRLIGFDPMREPSDQVSRYLRPMEKAVVNGQGFAQAAIRLRNSGFTPDIVMAHSGWGSGSFAKVVWPKACFVQYLEWWYAFPARDVAEPVPPELVEDRHAQALCRNLPFLLDAQTSDALLTPTAYQAADVPAMLRDRLTVMHDGVDCDFFSPGQSAPIEALKGRLPDGAPLLTYATRGMEPMRGFPEFMAALSLLQARMPQLHAVVAGEDTVHYDPKLPAGDSYKKRALATHEFDHERLHFTGRLPYAAYRDLLRLSDAHCYLTRPFVLSWSAIEAMAVGCPMVVSDCAPVREVLPNKTVARHVDHRDPAALADAIQWMLEHPDEAQDMGDAARRRAERHFDASTLFPRKEEWLNTLLEG